MTPADAAIVLALNRCWSSDGWALKPHDLFDLRMLGRSGLTRAKLEARADALGCGRSVALFLERCNPWEPRLHLDAPSRRQRYAWSLAASPERFPSELERKLMKLSRAPGALVDVLRILPKLFAVRRALRARPSLSALFAPKASPRGQGRRQGYLRLHRTVRGGFWAARFLKPLLDREESGLCLIRSLAIYHALQELGYPVSFVSGVRRTGERLEGHAWVEYQGRPVPGFGDELALRLYREVYRYPPRMVQD